MSFHRLPTTHRAAPDYRALFEGAPDLYLALSPDLSIVGASEAYVRAVMMRRESLIGRHVLDVLCASAGEAPVPTLGAWRASLERVKKTAEPDTMDIQRYRVRGRERADEAGAGPERHFIAVNSPVLDVAGKVAYILHRVEDVTALIQARRSEDNARRAHEISLEAHRRKDNFLAILGHELRNPLAPILTALELMRLRGGDAFARERGVIERQVRYVVRLIEDLLDLTRIARGKVQLKREPIELAQAIARAVELASALVEERRHTLEVSAPPVGLPVEGDLVRLSQVIANLVVNAAKYTDPGGRIEVLAERRAGDVVVRVRDTGVGIAPDVLPRLFELYAQAERSLDSAQGGLGIGLAVVRSLVEMHGGAVSVASDGVGRGSEFTVTLPAMTRGAEPLGRPEPLSHGAAVRMSSMPPGAKRVLIVDDNPDAAATLADVLRELGYAAQVAYDGASALAEEARFHPDVALLDIGLPIMDGHELARRLRAQRGPIGIRLIAVSGYGRDVDMQQSKATGFDAHLVKPFEIDALADTLERMWRAAG